MTMRHYMSTDHWADASMSQAKEMRQIAASQHENANLWSIKISAQKVTSCPILHLSDALHCGC